MRAKSDAAAVIVQRMYRGMIGRRRTEIQKEKIENESFAAEILLRQLGTWLRKYKFAMTLSRLRDAAIRIQSYVRMVPHRKQFAKLMQLKKQSREQNMLDDVRHGLEAVSEQMDSIIRVLMPGWEPEQSVWGEVCLC